MISTIRKSFRNNKNKLKVIVLFLSVYFILIKQFINKKLQGSKFKINKLIKKNNIRKIKKINRSSYILMIYLNLKMIPYKFYHKRITYSVQAIKMIN